MIKRIYSLYDKLAKNYSDPFVAVNDDVVFRQLRFDKTLAVVPEDFDLYCLGEFDSDTGEVVRELGLVAHVASLLRKKEEKDE